VNGAAQQRAKPKPIIIEILKKGYMEIEASFIMKYYKKRYFMLKSNLKLEYYDSPNQKRPEEVINLLKVVALKKCATDDMFEIEVSNRDRRGDLGLFESETTCYRLRCESAEIQKGWFNRIAQLIEANGSDQQKQAKYAKKGGLAEEQKGDLLSAASAPPADNGQPGGNVNVNVNVNAYPALSSNVEAPPPAFAPGYNNGNQGDEGQAETNQ